MRCSACLSQCAAELRGSVISIRRPLTTRHTAIRQAVAVPEPCCRQSRPLGMQRKETICMHRWLWATAHCETIQVQDPLQSAIVILILPCSRCAEWCVVYLCLGVPRAQVVPSVSNSQQVLRHLAILTLGQLQAPSTLPADSRACSFGCSLLRCFQQALPVCQQSSAEVLVPPRHQPNGGEDSGRWQMRGEPSGSASQGGVQENCHHTVCNSAASTASPTASGAAACCR